MKVFLITNSSYAHTKSFVSIAVRLKELGHEVVIGCPRKNVHLVQSHNIEYVELVIDSWSTMTSFKSFTDIINTYKGIILDITSGNTLYRKMSKASKALNVIVAQEADVILIDRFIAYMLTLSGSIMGKAIVISTQMNPYRSKYIAPLNLNLSPQDAFFNVRHNFAWSINPLRHYFRSLLILKQDTWSILRKINFFLKKKPLEVKGINKKNNSYHFGFQSVPEYSVGYSGFEFPIIAPKKEIGYLALKNFRLSNNSAKDQLIIKQVQDFKSKTNQKIIYFSLGTLAKAHNSKIERFIKMVLSIFEIRKDWRLIFSEGGGNLNLKKNLSENIVCYNFVPQQQILPYCDMMISHGGLTTITECIFSETPMLIFPLNRIWDQQGNAARARYHGVAQVGNIKNINATKLEGILEHILRSEKYKKNLQHLRQKLVEEHAKANIYLNEMLADFHIEARLSN